MLAIDGPLSGQLRDLLAVAGLSCIVLPIGYALFHLRRKDRQPRGLCTHCGYDLTGNLSGVCPECGKAIAKGDQ